VLGPGALALALCAAVAVIACGGSGDDDERAVEDRVYALYDAFAEQDTRVACASLTASARRAIADPRRGCEPTLWSALEASGIPDSGVSEIEVTDVAIDGDTAEARVRLRGVRSRLRLLREGGEWRVDRLPGGDR
jgi:hypothetical protein